MHDLPLFVDCERPKDALTGDPARNRGEQRRRELEFRPTLDGLPDVIAQRFACHSAYRLGSSAQARFGPQSEGEMNTAPDAVAPVCQNRPSPASSPTARPSRMKTLAFCTSWAADDDVWRFRYAKWLAHMRRSPLHADQILVIDDASRGEPDFGEAAVLPASALPQDCPRSPVVLARFAERLGRAAVHDYPGWWRSFAFAADYAERYGFDKVVHVESDSYILSPRLHDYVNRLEHGWAALWCPRWSFPETCIQVIGPDLLPMLFDSAAQPYSAFAGRSVEKILPFTHVESNFKGDRYGEFRTELPLDCDYATQVPWSTAVWSGAAPPPRRVLALTVGDNAIPPHPTLYPRDAWQVQASERCAQIDELAPRCAANAAGSLDAVQVALPAEAALGAPLPLQALRRLLGTNGELALHLRPNGDAASVSALGQSMLERGFAGMGTEQVPVGGDWILAVCDDNDLGPVLGQERLTLRLQFIARCHGYHAAH